MSIIKKMFKKERKITIDICSKNLDRHYDEASIDKLVHLFSESNIKVSEYECLSQCELCEEKCYVQVNNKKISASSSKALFDKLQELIK